MILAIPVSTLRPDGYLLDDFEYIDEQEAAPAIGVSVQTLIKYRKLQIGPPYSVVGRRIIYHRPKLKTWLDAGGTKGALERAPAAPAPASPKALTPPKKHKPERVPSSKRMARSG